METPDKLVVFNLDDRRFAMPLSAVVRVERIVAITPLPRAPEIVLGVVNMHGQIIPVREKGFKFAA